MHVKNSNGTIFASVEYTGKDNHLDDRYNMPWTGTITTPVILPAGTASYQIDYCLGGRIVDNAGNMSDQLRICLTRE